MSGFTEGLVALGVILGILWIVLTKVAKENPRAAEFMQSVSLKNMTEKIVPEKIKNVRGLANSQEVIM